LNPPLLRSVLLLALLSTPLSSAAVGLGELRGQAVLGERLRVEIDIIGADRRYPEATCFRLIRPTGSNDLPWLQSASLAVRGGKLPVLEIRSSAILRDPVMQIGVQLGCGYEISRDYVLLAMPAVEPAAGPAVPLVLPETRVPSVEAPPRRAVRRTVPRDADNVPPRLTPRRAEVPARAPVDRLMLSGGGDAGEQMLQMATELGSLRGDLTASEAQREILRLEFRMLMALGEQADSQLATAEKLRNMEATLGDLQMRAADFAGRVEQGVAAQPPATPVPLVPALAAAAKADQPLVSEWSLYGVVIGIALGLAGWLGWRSYEQRRQHRDEGDFPLLSADPLPAEGDGRPTESKVHSEVDISFDSAEDHTTTQVDLELEGAGENPTGNLLQAEAPRPVVSNSAMSITGAAVGEHFEANPVMELAEIMLSFGRVKGAAQALREYIDSSPQEALQPWIRLMDVYRMAGMRDEFEEVGRNLNQHFNVEIQHWETVRVPDVSVAESIEDMPRIMSMISELWWAGDVVGYLYQLLRDNRGGKRLGFALPVVEEILFLIELKETSNRIEKKEDRS
jgi:hypothetical protein